MDRWLVRMGVGASLAKEVHDAPLPDDLGGHPNVDHAGEWRNELANDGYEMVQAAGAFHMCSEVARRAHVADEHARICEAWLAEHAGPHPL